MYTWCWVAANGTFKEITRIFRWMHCIFQLRPLHQSEIKGTAAGISDYWLKARHTCMYNTHTHTRTHAHTWANAPILLYNPNLSESTLCLPPGFPPFLSAHHSFSFCSCFSSFRLLISSHLVLHSSSSQLICLCTSVPSQMTHACT